MLKLAFELGKQIALEEAGLTKEAAPIPVTKAVREALPGVMRAVREGGTKAAASPGFLSRAWQAATKTPARKALLGAGGALGAGGLGYAMWPKQEDPSMLQQLGTTAQDILANPQLMAGLTSALTGGGGGFGLGLTPGQGFEQFPPAPQGLPQQQYQQPQQEYYQ